MVKMYDKVVVNIPYSSMEKCYECWHNCSEMFPLVRNITNWHTDLLFSSDLVTYIRFPFSRLYCDVMRNIGDKSEKNGLGVIYTKFEGFKKNISDVREPLNWYSIHRKYIEKSMSDNSILINALSTNSKDMATDVSVCIYKGVNTINDEVLDKICSIFENKGYYVALDVKEHCPYVLDGENCVCIDININKRAYMDEETLLPKKKEFSKMKSVINDLYKYLLDKK